MSTATPTVQSNYEMLTALTAVVNQMLINNLSLSNAVATNSAAIQDHQQTLDEILSQLEQIREVIQPAQPDDPPLPPNDN